MKTLKAILTAAVIETEKYSTFGAIGCEDFDFLKKQAIKIYAKSFLDVEFKKTDNRIFENIKTKIESSEISEEHGDKIYDNFTDNLYKYYQEKKQKLNEMF